ncbi:MAG: hypothetical protein A2148_08520 [Chloroflexi bacterium RBG_16_68_14]|nr:MAG: hypothetical protein A2148_08520 [Chloroflexi bacterium RBG_16_68_14]
MNHGQGDIVGVGYVPEPIKLSEVIAESSQAILPTFGLCRRLGNASQLVLLGARIESPLDVVVGEKAMNQDTRHRSSPGLFEGLLQSSCGSIRGKRTGLDDKPGKIGATQRPRLGG